MAEKANESGSVQGSGGAPERAGTVADPRAAERGTGTGGGEAGATPAGEAGAGRPRGVGRREFFRQTGVRAGAVAAGVAALDSVLASCAVSPGRDSPEIAVVGAGAFGAWTAYWLRELGARVTLVDMYGPGNSRATSGGETRGVRTSYGNRSTGELWTSWANRAIDRWLEFDERWAGPDGQQLFFQTGDLIMREDWDPMTSGSRDMWDQLGIPYEVLDHDEIRYRHPQIDVEGIQIGLYEPRAGVVRARRACETVAGVFQRRGGTVRIARAEPGSASGGRLNELALEPGGESLGAEIFIFALGPWFPTFFPGFMGDLIRTPIGNVFYYGTPPGDNRFTYPNMPSYNFPGVTGWPSLPPDNRGFRVRTGGHAGDPSPDRSVRWFDESNFERPLQVLERFPDLVGAPLLETRSCHYEISATRNWLIDHHPDYSNVWIAGGGSAEAFKFGPVLGEYIAKRVLGRDEHPELAEEFRIPEPEPAVT